MKASEVTKAMLDAFDDGIDTSLDSEQKIIAAAVNAYLGDDTPITFALLKERGYTVDDVGWIGIPSDAGEGSPAIDFEYEEDRSIGCCYVSSDRSRVNCNCIELPHIKTIGQLRALEIGLGLRD